MAKMGQKDSSSLSNVGQCKGYSLLLSASINDDNRIGNFMEAIGKFTHRNCQQKNSVGCEQFINLLAKPLKIAISHRLKFRLYSYGSPTS